MGGRGHHSLATAAIAAFEVRTGSSFTGQCAFVSPYRITSREHTRLDVINLTRTPFAYWYSFSCLGAFFSTTPVEIAEQGSVLLLVEDLLPTPSVDRQQGGLASAIETGRNLSRRKKRIRIFFDFFPCVGLRVVFLPKSRVERV